MSCAFLRGEPAWGCSMRSIFLLCKNRTLHNSKSVRSNLHLDWIKKKSISAAIFCWISFLGELAFYAWAVRRTWRTAARLQHQLKNESISKVIKLSKKCTELFVRQELYADVRLHPYCIWLLRRFELQEPSPLAEMAYLFFFFWRRGDGISTYSTN
jgi:hypothetical protein